MSGGACQALDRFGVALEVVIRRCDERDLPGLEWWGMFTPHREIFTDAYARHRRGENVMLVADVNGHPAGQAWIDLVKHAADGVGVLWAVRVFPLLQGLGIGTRLMEAAEDELRRRGYAWAEIEVERENAGARRLYERQGYAVVHEVVNEWGYTTPEGVPMRHVEHLSVMRKPLHAGDPFSVDAGRAASTVGD